MDVSIVDYPVTIKVGANCFAFIIDAGDRAYKVRPMAFPEARLRACAGARWSLLHDGKGRFIYVATDAEPTNLHEARALAQRWATALMEDAFPTEWPRDRNLWR